MHSGFTEVEPPFVSCEIIHPLITFSFLIKRMCLIQANLLNIYSAVMIHQIVSPILVPQGSSSSKTPFAKRQINFLVLLSQLECMRATSVLSLAERFWSVISLRDLSFMRLCKYDTRIHCPFSWAPLGIALCTLLKRRNQREIKYY
jgi:hypothetical protein